MLSLLLVSSQSIPFSSQGIALRRTFSVNFCAEEEWIDVTPLVTDALPALPCAVAHLEAGGTGRIGVTLLDPRLLTLGSLASIAPGASSQHRLALAVERGELLLPADVRILALRAGDVSDASMCELSLQIELAAPLALSPGALPAHSQRARAALHGCLAEAGLPPASVAALEATRELGTASPAQSVYAAFIRADPPPLARRKKQRGRAGAIPRGTRNAEGEGALIFDGGAADSVGEGGSATEAPLLRVEVSSDRIASDSARDGSPAVQAQMRVEAGAALMAGARRAAHHIVHLLKAERVATADWFRNTDECNQVEGASGGDAIATGDGRANPHQGEGAFRDDAAAAGDSSTNPHQGEEVSRDGAVAIGDGSAHLHKGASLIGDDAVTLRDGPDNTQATVVSRDRTTDTRDSPATPQRVAVTLVLDNVRSAYNVGSIFRTADTACLAEVVTCGFTPHPPHPKLHKTGFGAIGSVPSRHFGSTLAALAALRAEGIVQVAAMETTERSESYVTVDLPRSGVAIVMGNEEVGVDMAVLNQCDRIIEIPTLGTKNSLNVASAASVVVFEVLRKWGSLER
jgi:tRNA G18 (ribose-2'-O)-methylase SpoU